MELPFYKWNKIGISMVRPCVLGMPGLSSKVGSGRNIRCNWFGHFPWKQRLSSQKLVTLRLSDRGCKGKMMHPSQSYLISFDLCHVWKDPA